MADELDEIYIYSGVIWLIRFSNMPDETLGDVAGSLFTGSDKTTGLPLLPAFSNGDLASRFITQAGIPGVVPFRFTDPAQLLTILEALPGVGVNDVAIDMDESDATYWPVTRLIERVKRFIK